MACDLRGISLRWVRGLAIFGRFRQWAAIDPEDSSGGTESLEGRPISLFSRKKETSVIAGSALMIGSLGMAPMAHAQGGTTTIGAGAIAIIGSVGSAAIGSSDSAPEVPSGDVEDAPAPEVPAETPAADPAKGPTKDEAAAVAPAKAPARQESEVVQATGGLPVTGVDAGVLAGIAGALLVLGALLIGRRATAN